MRPVETNTSPYSLIIIKVMAFGKANIYRNIDSLQKVSRNKNLWYILVEGVLALLTIDTFEKIIIFFQPFLLKGVSKNAYVILNTTFLIRPLLVNGLIHLGLSFLLFIWSL